MNQQVTGALVVMALFGGLALFGLAVIKDYRGLLTKFESRHPVGSLDRLRARRASLLPAWGFVIMGTAAVIGIPVSALAHAH